jgi:large subunit ribosomal protein L21
VRYKFAYFYATPQLASLIKEVNPMYAIIATGGKQYKVAEGDVIRVEKLGAEAGSEVTFDDVILVSTDSDVKCGDAVANATVTASVIGDGKAKKVVVYKYKRKTGYHKKNGHRQAYTQVEIKSINA